MATLAIKGHLTRGKEVIEILEMLGGVNAFNLEGTETQCFCYIFKDNNKIYYCWSTNAENVIVYTIEEFEEKFPYKVGDKVTLDKYPCVITGMNWDCDDIIYYVKGADFSKGVYSKDKDLQPYKEETIEESIDKTNKVIFETNAQCCDIRNEIIKKDMEEIEIALAPFKVGDKVIVKGYEKMGEDEIIYVFKTYDGDIKYKTKNHLDTHYFMEDSLTKVENSYKEETMKERKYADLRLDVDQDDKLATEVTIDGDKITPPENYLIGKITKVDNGVLVEFVKKQPQYPKTYRECSLINGCEDRIPLKIIEEFIKLINARNAYWKLAGEEMGLGKPWKPDWNDVCDKYTIYVVYGNEIWRDIGQNINTLLAFPTMEMRDTFYENFKSLIENCKELL